MGDVVRITEYRNRDTIQILEELLEKARNGELTGMIFGVRLNEWNHGVGVTGAYRDDVVSALGASGRIFHLLNEQADKLTSQQE